MAAEPGRVSSIPELLSVHVVGAGLIGTSIALGLQERGHTVTVEDSSSEAERLARLRGLAVGGNHRRPPGMVFVCVPPDSTAENVVYQLRRFPEAGVLDVCSVKAAVAHRIEKLLSGAQNRSAERYLGTHPLAGREIGGTLAGSPEIFLGRPWVLCPRARAQGALAASQGTLLERTAGLLESLGAETVIMAAEEHDEAVARISHLPQLMSTLTALLLEEAQPQAVAISGPGLKDVSRLAGSDPELWEQIVRNNRKPVLAGLHTLRQRVDDLIAALAAPESSALRTMLAAGKQQVARIPGKHGLRPGAHHDYVKVHVLVDDRPGRLALLLRQVDAAQLNLEDLRVEHSPAHNSGIAELTVVARSGEALVGALRAAGWKLLYEQDSREGQHP